MQARDYGMPFRNAAAQEFVAEIKKPLKTEQIKEWLRNAIPYRRDSKTWTAMWKRPKPPMRIYNI